MRTGTAHLPLHGGKAPAWLFSRMTLLAREIVALLAAEFGTGEVLARLSDPYWFQAFGCVLGFDWHSSGVTTTVCGAVKEAMRGGLGKELGLFVAGGKGNASRKTPDELRAYVEKDVQTLDPETLVYASRMSAKVDNTAVQDGYQLYHHLLPLRHLRRVGGGAAGHARHQRHGAALPLALQRRGGFRQRAARRHLLAGPRPAHTEHDGLRGGRISPHGRAPRRRAPG